jgi:hypothetical protein
MRRLTILAVALALSLLLAGSASARSLRMRTDPNDSPGSADIRKVWTDASQGVFVRISTWKRVSNRRASYTVALDTKGSRDYDFTIGMSGHFGEVSTVDEHRFVTGDVGQRRVRRINPRTFAFLGPRGWFDLEKPVRFVVLARTTGGRRRDRAPNVGRYIRL